MDKTILMHCLEGGLVIGDGAYGTMLHRNGLPSGMLPEAWNLENPEAVKDLHRDYLDAGAMFLTTNTLGANRIRLRDAGLADRTTEVLQRGIQLAKDVSGDEAWVGVSIGSTGQLIEPYGSLSLAEVESIFGEQMRVVADSPADFVKIETQTDLAEACCAVRMAKEHTNLPIVCSFSFDLRGRTIMGARAEKGAARVAEAGADITGANCGDGPEAIRVALEKMAPTTDLPLLAQANAGIPQAGAHGEAVWDVTSEQMAQYAQQLAALGAQIVGGCCGTNPDFIRAIAEALAG